MASSSSMGTWVGPHEGPGALGWSGRITKKTGPASMSREAEGPADARQEHAFDCRGRSIEVLTVVSGLSRGNQVGQEAHVGEHLGKGPDDRGEGPLRNCFHMAQSSGLS